MKRVFEVFLGILTAFADLCAVSPERQDLGNDVERGTVTSSREYFNTFLRSLDAEREGLPPWFMNLLQSPGAIPPAWRLDVTGEPSTRRELRLTRGASAAVERGHVGERAAVVFEPAEHFAGDTQMERANTRQRTMTACGNP